MADMEVPTSDLPESGSAEPQAQAAAQPQEVPQHDLPPVSGQEVPPEDHPIDPEKYSSTGQQVAGAAEAAARSATFGLSTPIEEKLGIASHEDIKGREAALDPMVAIGAETTGTIGSMLIPGVGEGWLLAKGAKLLLPIAKEANMVAKVGRLALRGAIEMGGFAAGDELSDALLDKGHDGTAVAGHIVGAGALGLLTGGLFGSGEHALDTIQNAKLGEYLDNVAIGLGAAAKGEEHVSAIGAMHDMLEQKIPKGVEHGIKLYGALSEHIAGKLVDAASAVGGALLGHIGGVGGEALGAKMAYEAAKKWLEPYADKLASQTINKKVVTPVLLKALSTGEHMGITDALRHGTRAAKGVKMASDAVQDLFNVGGKEAAHAMERDNDKLDKYMEDGGIDQQIDELKDTPPVPRQGLAEGGAVEAKPIQSTGGVATMYPAQHQMLTATKGRVSQYLNSVRPSKPVGMMYDTEHKDATKERTYRSALSVANAPLSVITHVKNGTVTPEHIKHLSSMYPELHDHLSKKITETMVKHQHDEEKRPNYKVRQGLAMFMGSPLDSTMTPQSIQAAQATYIQQQPQQPQQGQKNKKDTGSLSKFSKDYQTASQSREQRESKD